MVDFIATLYIAMQVCAIILAWPQIRKLYLAKQSSELSLTTWVTWLMSSLVTMAYASTTGQFIWLCANIGWATFYVVMVILIIRYRQQTIYQQVVHLFKMRFYFAVSKSPAKVPAETLPHDLVDKLHHKD